MTNTYTWFIDSLECIPSFEGQANVVSTVHWRVNAVSDQRPTMTINNVVSLNPYTATVCGTQQLNYVAGKPFKAYSKLTENTVIQWVQDAMGADQVASIETSLDTQINNLANPPVVSLPLPWPNNAY
jgi:hypothetical protein